MNSHNDCIADLSPINKIPISSTQSIQKLNNASRTEGTKGHYRTASTSPATKLFSPSGGNSIKHAVSLTKKAEASISQFSYINRSTSLATDETNKKLASSRNLFHVISSNLDRMKSANTMGSAFNDKESELAEKRMIENLFSYDFDDADERIPSITEEIDNIKLRKNLQSSILRENKNTLFNNSMVRFNKRKNKETEGAWLLDVIELPLNHSKENHRRIRSLDSHAFSAQQKLDLGNTENRITLEIPSSQLSKNLSDIVSIGPHLPLINEASGYFQCNDHDEEVDLDDSQLTEKTCVRDLTPSMNANVKVTLKGAVENIVTDTNNILRVINDENYVTERLVKLIYLHDIQLMESFLQEHGKTIDLNKKDGLENTPLMLASKLCYKSLDYHKIVQLLLKHGGDPSIRDANGWTCIDEAVCQTDPVLLGLVFDALLERKKRMFSRQEKELKKLLDKTPDFYLEMRWDFESSLIPFLSKLAPNDTFKIWKYKNKLRLDNTLVSIKRLKCKRRNMSTIIEVKGDRDFDKYPEIYAVNHSKKQFTNLFEEIDQDEKKLTIADLLKADPLQGNFELKSCNCAESKNWFGSKVTQRVNEWDTKKLEFKVEFDYILFKKSKAPFKKTFDEYIRALRRANQRINQEKENADNQGNRPELVQKELEKAQQEDLPPKEKETQMQRSKSTKGRIEDLIQNKDKLKIKVETKENAKARVKKQNAFIWVAEKFPISFNSIFQALNFLSKGNKILAKLQDVLNSEAVQNVINSGGFPVKLQIPLTLSVKANIVFTKFEYFAFFFKEKTDLCNMHRLLKKDENLDHLFEIPKDYNYTERKVIQKTIARPKKRMVLVNLLI